MNGYKTFEHQQHDMLQDRSRASDEEQEQKSTNFEDQRVKEHEGFFQVRKVREGTHPLVDVPKSR